MFDLTKIYWIIFQSHIKLLFLEIYNIVIQNRRSPLPNGSFQWHFQLRLLLFLLMKEFGSSIWARGNSIVSWLSGFASWIMSYIITWSFLVAIVGIVTYFSSKTKFLSLELPSFSTSSMNLTLPVSKKDLLEGS